MRVESNDEMLLGGASSGSEIILAYTPRAGWPSGLLCGRRLGDVNLTWIMSFHPQKVEYFCFYTVYMDPIVKISDFEVIFTSQNVFYFFFKKT